MLNMIPEKKAKLLIFGPKLGHLGKNFFKTFNYVGYLVLARLSFMQKIRKILRGVSMKNTEFSILGPIFFENFGFVKSLTFIKT